MEKLTALDHIVVMIEDYCLKSGYKATEKDLESLAILLEFIEGMKNIEGVKDNE